MTKFPAVKTSPCVSVVIRVTASCCIVSWCAAHSRRSATSLWCRIGTRVRRLGMRVVISPLEEPALSAFAFFGTRIKYTTSIWPFLCGIPRSFEITSAANTGLWPCIADCSAAASQKGICRVRRRVLRCLSRTLSGYSWSPLALIPTVVTTVIAAIAAKVIFVVDHMRGF